MGDWLLKLVDVNKNTFNQNKSTQLPHFRQITLFHKRRDGGVADNTFSLMATENIDDIWPTFEPPKTLVTPGQHLGHHTSMTFGQHLGHPKQRWHFANLLPLKTSMTFGQIFFTPQTSMTYWLTQHRWLMARISATQNIDDIWPLKTSMTFGQYLLPLKHQWHFGGQHTVDDLGPTVCPPKTSMSFNYSKQRWHLANVCYRPNIDDTWPGQHNMDDI